MSSRILVIDDDPLMTDVVSAALSAKGFAVDQAESCLSAIDLIKQNNYDLALIDYQMPDIDGLTSARLLQSLTAETHVPRLVALTGSVDELKAQDGAEDAFYDVLEKPVSPTQIARYVERVVGETDRGRLAALARSLWQQRGFKTAPRAITVPQPTREQAMALSLFFEPAQAGDADCIVLTKETGAGELEQLRLKDGNHVLPVVDLTGRARLVSDAALNAASPEDWSDTADTVARFVRNRSRLETRYETAENLKDQLLAYLYVSERDFAPSHDPSHPSCVSYPGCFPQNAVAAAEDLVTQGLLSRRFADRFYVCGACQSKRLSVREECPACRSADIEESELIHHFRCAHQAPEEAFRSGAQLICPKCKSALRHYGHDYDRPGKVFVCGSCGAWNSEPAVGFVCMDCDTHSDAEAIARQDVYAYSLTAKARERLTGDARPMRREAPQIANGRVHDKAHDKALGEPAGDRAIALPEELLSSLHSLGLDPNVGQEMFQVVEVLYGAEDGIVARSGYPLFAKLRRLFLENVGNLLADYGRVVPGERRDYLVLADDDAASLEAFLTRAFAHSEETLVESLRPEYRLVPRQEIVAAS
ncbi:Gliding motility regulatory protein [Methyloligella halotolerans]|uniref:Gliding motility regulatory protein n=1 Tax=Methyloligella halotolerans TaxID=1177755 RepID=A0A1E2S174_9HYPH|nr:response regulator [Methyloligella halotolerans]ODA68246.1 Gliding motility regulatory protein [Methyloligella halotolerans]